MQSSAGKRAFAANRASPQLIRSISLENSPSNEGLAVPPDQSPPTALRSSTEPRQSQIHEKNKVKDSASASTPTQLPSPPGSTASSISPRPLGRRWNPARGVDVFKQQSEEVLARFLSMGSWEGN